MTLSDLEEKVGDEKKDPSETKTKTLKKEQSNVNMVFVLTQSQRDVVMEAISKIKIEGKTLGDSIYEICLAYIKDNKW